MPATQLRTSVRVVLLDVDGTLVDHESAAAGALTQWLASEVLMPTHCGHRARRALAGDQ